LTKSLAAEWGPLGIRVNSIAPGTTRTDRNQWTPEIEARAAQTVPLGRVGDQTEIAKAVLFLASDLASYITGQTLVVDGGATILSPSPFQ
ncbi:MAG: SDR family oxidoreductase, partial [Chloroflexota bacterium]